MRNEQFAPFIRTEKNAPFLYMNVLLGLFPCILLAIAYYGLKALLLILSSQILFFAFDILLARILREEETRTVYFDFSSIISGTIFALLLPPNTSLLVVVIGSAFGSIVVKQLFGGVGTNLINPGISARLFVELILGEYLTCFSSPLENWFDVRSLIAFCPSAGELGDTTNIYFAEVLFGKFATFIGTGSGLLIAIGVIFIIAKRVVRGYAFFGYMVTIILAYPIIHYSEIASLTGLRSYVVFLLSSGVILIAAFALGDFTTMPMSPIMRMLSSSICAVLTLILETRTSLIIALCAPVLLVNLLTPTLDYFTSSVTHKEIAKKNRGDSL